jgi:predicted acetyltransferase
VEAAARLCHAGAAADAGRGEAVGLPYVEITAKPGNPASHKVILANGGRLVGRFFEDAAYGGVESLRFRIDL